jgi:hypothetical protein
VRAEKGKGIFLYLNHARNAQRGNSDGERGHVCLHGREQEQKPPPRNGYIVIDKSKLGRPRRDLTSEGDTRKARSGGGHKPHSKGYALGSNLPKQSYRRALFDITGYFLQAEEQRLPRYFYAINNYEIL